MENRKELNRILQKPLSAWTVHDEKMVNGEIERILKRERSAADELSCNLLNRPIGERSESVEKYLAGDKIMQAERSRCAKSLMILCRLNEILENERIMHEYNMRGENIMEENRTHERKTEDLMSGADFIHKSYDKSKSISGTIKGDINKYVIKKEDGSVVYAANFVLQPINAKTLTINIDMRSIEPINLSEYEKGDKALSVAGQRFLVSHKDKDGKITGSKETVLFVRSAHEAVINDGKKVMDSTPIYGAEKAVKTEFYRAANELLTGCVFESEFARFNKEIVYRNPETNIEELYGYAHNFSVRTPKYEAGKPVISKDGKPESEYVRVEAVTREQIDPAAIISTKESIQKLSMKGAYRVYDYKDSNGEWHNNVVSFEPVVISKYLKKEIEKNKKKEDDLKKEHFKKDPEKEQTKARKR